MQLAPKIEVKQVAIKRIMVQLAQEYKVGPGLGSTVSKLATEEISPRRTTIYFILFHFFFGKGQLYKGMHIKSVT